VKHAVVAPRLEDDGLLDVSWEVAPVPPAAGTPGRWLLLGGGALGDGLRSALEAAGHAAVHAPAPGGDEPAARAAIAAGFGGSAPTAIVHLGSLEGDARDGDESISFETGLVRGCDSVLSTVQAIARLAFRDAPRLWLVTRGAQATARGEGASVAQAPLLGLGRVIAMEHAELRCARVDLAAPSSEGEIADLAAELLADDAEEEIALRASERRVSRLVHGELRVAREAPAAGGPVRLEIDEPQVRALLDKLLTLIESGAVRPPSTEPSPVGDAASALRKMAQARHLGKIALTVDEAAEDARAGRERAVTIRSDASYVVTGIHAAGVLDDGLLTGLTPARVRAVTGPKALGAIHVHQATRGAALDFFVMYASASGLLGSPGQGSYAAANAALDALAHHRRACGLPATTVDWGPFAEVGMAAAQANRGARFAAYGMRSLSLSEGLSVLERLLAHDVTQIGVLPLDVRHWVEAFPAVAASRRLSRLVDVQRSSPGGAKGDPELLARVSASAGDGRAALLKTFLRSQASRVLRLPEDRVKLDAPFTSLGMDSLMGLELRNRIEAGLGVRLPATLLWTYPTITDLGRQLARELSDRLEPETPPQPAPPSAPPVDEAVLQQMSDEELARIGEALLESDR
jgi:acyl carrier protein